jgi:hypothetical protein
MPARYRRDYTRTPLSKANTRRDGYLNGYSN